MLKKCIVFDLDDTLYKEIDFVYSAFTEINQILRLDVLSEMKMNFHHGKNVFLELIDKYKINYSLDELLHIYRNHIPNIHLEEGALDVLNYIKQKHYYLGLITDGRSITQRNKLKALGIVELFDKIVISEEIGSEKPNINNFQVFYEFCADEYYYIADNPKKDFIAPLKLNWETVVYRGDSLRNIHFSKKIMKINIYKSIINFKELISLL